MTQGPDPADPPVEDLPPCMNGRDEWRVGWPLVATGALGVALVALPFFSLGVFLEPIARDTGWSRTQISLGLTLLTAITVLGAPFVGLLVDRVGPRRVALSGALAYSVAVWTLAAASASVWHWWAAWLVIGVAHVFVTPMVWTTAVASRFRVSRGLALATVLAGSGLSTALAPALGGALLERLDWRWAYPTLVAGCALLVAILSALFLYGTKDLARKQSSKTSAPNSTSGATLGEGIRSRAFWQLNLAALLVAIPALGVVTHFVPMVRAGGLPAQEAAQVAGALGLSVIVGRLSTGYLLDRIDGRIVGGVSFALPIAACALLFVYDGSASSALIIAIIAGLATGSEADISAYLLSRHLGLRSFGALYGTLVGLVVLATGLAPLSAAIAYDAEGSYQTYYVLGGLMCLTATALIVSLGRYPALSSPVSEEALAAASTLSGPGLAAPAATRQN